MRSGALRHRITLQQPTITRGTDGTVIETWATFKQVWAEIIPLSGRELYAAQQVNSETTHRVRIRYLANLDTVKRISYKGRTFDILSKLNTQERNYELVMECREVD